MTTSDYFLANRREIAKVCRGWASDGDDASEDATSHVEYAHLPWVDLEPIDMIPLANLASALSGVQTDIDELVEYLTGPEDCEQMVGRLPQGFVDTLANQTDTALRALRDRWSVLQVADARAGAERQLASERAAAALPMLISLRELARQAVDTNREMYVLWAP